MKGNLEKLQQNIKPCFKQKLTPKKFLLNHAPALLRNCAGHEVVQILPGVVSLDNQLGEGSEVNESDTFGHNLVLSPHCFVPVSSVLYVGINEDLSDSLAICYTFITSNFNLHEVSTNSKSY